jgi:hypothetical protein
MKKRKRDGWLGGQVIVQTLPEDYLKNAGRIAQIRATEAGFKLAGVRRESLND